jgi:hypothetical protein
MYAAIGIQEGCDVIPDRDIAVQRIGPDPWPVPKGPRF